MSTLNRLGFALMVVTYAIAAGIRLDGNLQLFLWVVAVALFVPPWKES